MSDSEIVASIVTGDPEGLAAAYDKYAGDVYGYCQSLLQDPDDAADAVQDTFVIAVSKLAGLRDPERLRAWLFAVARNECLHRLKSRHAATPLHDASEPADDSVDVGGEAERAETVALLRAAVGGLNDGERDVINQLWHGLDVPEVAAVLGVSRNHAYSLFSRARDQLEASLAVLLVGRAGRGDCATLDSLLGDWDGRLTALLRKRVGRHIDRCPVCSDRRRRELTPALLYGLAPAALLAVAGLRKISVLTAGWPGGPPSAVRDTVLHLSADPASHGTAFARVSWRSTQSFGGDGFPKPPHHGFLGVAPRPHMPFTVVGGTAVAAAATVVVTVVVPHMQPTQRPPGGGLTLGAPLPGALAPAGATGGGPSGGAPATGPRTRGGTAAAPGSARSTASGGPVTTSTSGRRPAGSTDQSTVPGSGAPATGTAGPPAVTAAPPAGGPQSAGTLSVSPTTVLLSPLLGGSLTLTASGGPVSWSISEPASLLGELIVATASGTLSAGSSVTVAVTVSGLVSLDTQLTVQPGGQAVTVVLGLG
jgi:RNA polymerase sigma factor (sigma-70 family)